MKEKAKIKVLKTKKTTNTYLKNIDELLSATSFTAVVAFAGYQALQHKQETILWTLLLAASVYSLFTAAKAWSRVLSKEQ